MANLLLTALDSSPVGSRRVSLVVDLDGQIVGAWFCALMQRETGCRRPTVWMIVDITGSHFSPTNEAAKQEPVLLEG